MKTPPIESMFGAFNVKGKNVVVTGGNRGIGFGIATAFAESGANVAVLCRNEESGKSAAESFAKHGGRYTCVQVDISDYSSVETAAKSVYEFFDHVDVLVNNAGVGPTTDFFSANGLEEWHNTINTNLHGVANMVYAIAPGMRESGSGGAIINISSIGAQRVSNSRKQPHPPYNVSKAGIDIFTKYLAIVLGGDGIRCNAIAPAFTRSDLGKGLPQKMLETVEDTFPTQRIGEPIEIGALCVFLASPAAVQITGAVIAHDGGMMTVT